MNPSTRTLSLKGRGLMKVLVLCGGQSSEHEISLQSAKTVLNALDPKRYEAVPVLIARDGRWLLQEDLNFLPSQDVPAPAKTAGEPVCLGAGRSLIAKWRRIVVDVAFPVLHGQHGEDGTVQGALELSGIPYVGCGVLASSIGMDKEMTKRLARLAGVPVPDDVVVRTGDALSKTAAWHRQALALGLPLFAKPAGLGSSVGVSKVSRPEELLPAVREAFRYDVKVLVEKGIDGAEICCGVLGASPDVRASICCQVVPRGHAFYTYEAKYVDPHGCDILIPAPIPKAVVAKVQDYARRAFAAVEGHGLARVDFFVEKNGKVWFGELNTIPGFTSHSLYPRLWAASGVPLARLLDRLLGLALKRGARRAKLLTVPA